MQSLLNSPQFSSPLSSGMHRSYEGSYDEEPTLLELPRGAEREEGEGGVKTMGGGREGVDRQLLIVFLLSQVIIEYQRLHLLSYNPICHTPPPLRIVIGGSSFRCNFP